MAEPLSILGAVAASIQLLEGSAKALRLAQEVREAPERVSEAIGDVQSSIDQILTIMSDRSQSFGKLTTDQFGRLSTYSVEYRKALDDLNRTLKPLMPEPDHKPHKRFFKSINFVKMDEEILRLSRRISRLHQNMSFALQHINLEVGSKTEAHAKGAEARSKSAEAYAKGAEARAKGAETHAKDAATESRACRAEGKLMASAIGSISSDIKTIGSQVCRIGDSNEQILQRVNDVEISSRSSHDSVMAHMTQLRRQVQESHTCSLFAAQLVSTLAGNGNTNLVEESLSVLSDDDRRIVAHQASWNLSRSPGALKDSCDKLSFTRYDQRRQWGRHQAPSCTCGNRVLDQSAMVKKGVFGFRFAKKGYHHSSCPRRHHGSRSWAYSFSLDLHFLLNQTVEFTFGSTSGAGGWSLASPLRFRATVRRADSPLFRLLDATRTSLYELPRGTLPTGPLVSDEMVATTRVYLETGGASALDLDESGNSVLEALFDVLEPLFFGRGGLAALDRNPSVHSGLIRLLELFLQAGADPFDTNGEELPKRLSRIWSGVTILIRYEPLPEDFPNRLPLYEDMQRLGFLETIEELEWDSVTADIRHSWFRLYPQLVAQCGVDAVSKALITRRSLEDLKRASEKEEERLKSGRFLNNMSAVELALGWPQALKYLVGIGCDVDTGFETACRLQDVESVRLILQTAQPLFRPRPSPFAPRPHPFSVYPHSLVQAFSSGDPQLFGLVIQEFARRRKKLNDLAMRNLHLVDIATLELRYDKPLVEKSAYVDHFLRNKHQDLVPPDLNCSFWVSTYSFLVECALEYGLESTEILAMIEATKREGFHDLDAENQDGESVLYTLCRRKAFTNNNFLTGTWVSLSRVIYSLSFQPERDKPFASLAARNSTYPGVLFYVAFLGPCALSGPDPLGRSAELDPRRFQWAHWPVPPLEHLDGLLTDECCCHCSSKGCMPHFMFQRCGGPINCLTYGPDEEKCGSFMRHTATLHLFARCLNLSREGMEQYYFEACRLEIFERLGMRHTCCAGGPRLPKPSGSHALARVPLSNTEREEALPDDSEDYEHLRAILDEYRKSRRAHPYSELVRLKPGKMTNRKRKTAAGQKAKPTLERRTLKILGPRQLWFLWWDAVGEIVPPLTTAEGCTYRSSLYPIIDPGGRDRLDAADEAVIDSRASSYKAAHAAAGYEGVPFDEIITRHFSKFHQVLAQIYRVRLEARTSMRTGLRTAVARTTGSSRGESLHVRKKIKRVSPRLGNRTRLWIYNMEYGEWTRLLK